MTEIATRLACGGQDAVAAARQLLGWSLQPATSDAALQLGAVQTMLPYLRLGTEPELLKLLTQAFSNFCRRADGEAAVQLELVSPALPLMKDLLSDEDEDVVEAACTVFINLTHGPNKVINFNDGVPEHMESILLLTSHEATKVKKAALSAVSNAFASDFFPVNYYSCVDPIIALLQSNDSALQLTAARAHSVLCRTSQVHSTHFREFDNDFCPPGLFYSAHCGAASNFFAKAPNGIWNVLAMALAKDIHTPLRNMLDSGEPECRVQAAQAIANLCRYGVAEQRWLVVSRDVLRPYCALLAGSDDALAALVLAGLNALVQATEEDDHEDSDPEEERKMTSLCSKLSEVGAPGLIQQILQRQVTDEDLHPLALELSTALRFCVEKEDVILEDGEVFTAVEICEELRSDAPLQRARAVRGAWRLLARARACGRARLAALSDVLEAAGGLAALLAPVHDDRCPALQLEAARAIANMTYERERNISTLLQAGVIPKLVALLSTKGELSEQAAIALRNIASHGPTSRNEVLRHNALEALVSKLKNAETPSWLYMSAFKEVLRDVGRSEVWSADVRESEILKRVLSVLPRMSSMLELFSYNYNQMVVHICGALVHIMSVSRQCRDAVQAVPHLTKMLVDQLYTFNEQLVQRAGLDVVNNMLEGDEAQKQHVLDNGCLPQIAAILRCSKPDLVAGAVRAACSILTGSRKQVQLALDEGILDLLRNILDEEKPECHKPIIEAIESICQHGTAAQRDTLVSSGALRPYCRLLADPHLVLDLSRKTWTGGLYWLLQGASEGGMDLEKLRTELTAAGVRQWLETLANDDGNAQQSAREILEKFSNLF